MKLDTRCCLCGRLDEDGGHLLLKCKEVKPVWRELNMEDIRCSLAEAESAKAMMEKVLKLQHSKQLTVVFLLWIWWDERNKKREEGRRRTAQEVVYITAAMADRLKQQPVRSLLSDSRQAKQWEKPCSDTAALAGRP